MGRRPIELVALLSDSKPLVCFHALLALVRKCVRLGVRRELRSRVSKTIGDLPSAGRPARIMIVACVPQL